jgi:hypothetical protein
VLQEPCAATSCRDVVSSRVPSSFNPASSCALPLDGGDDVGPDDAGDPSVVPDEAGPDRDDGGAADDGGAWEPRADREGPGELESDGGRVAPGCAPRKARNAVRMRSRFGGEKGALTSINPRFCNRWKIPDRVLMGSI